MAGNKPQGMEDDRMERVKSSGVHGDGRAGDEGVDDPAMSRTHRDNMGASSPIEDRIASGDMNEDLTAGNRGSTTQREQSQRSQRTNKRVNDETFDDAEGFSGQGGQKEGADEAEGTGYTGESSNTDDSEPGNPLV